MWLCLCGTCVLRQGAGTPEDAHEDEDQQTISTHEDFSAHGGDILALLPEDARLPMMKLALFWRDEVCQLAPSAACDTLTTTSSRPSLPMPTRHTARRRALSQSRSRSHKPNNDAARLSLKNVAAGVATAEKSERRATVDPARKAGPHDDDSSATVRDARQSRSTRV